MKIFVARLNFSTQDSDLGELFESYGEVISARIMVDQQTGRSRGFGFVEMPDEESARAAISELDGSEFDGRTIVVKVAEERA